MADGELEVLVEVGVGVVAVYVCLALARVHLGAEGELDVGVVEAALLAAGQLLRLDQVDVQVGLVEVVAEAQVQLAQTLARPATDPGRLVAAP